MSVKNAALAIMQDGQECKNVQCVERASLQTSRQAHCAKNVLEGKCRHQTNLLVVFVEMVSIKVEVLAYLVRKDSICLQKVPQSVLFALLASLVTILRQAAACVPGVNSKLRVKKNVPNVLLACIHQLAASHHALNVLVDTTLYRLGLIYVLLILKSQIMAAKKSSV